MERTGRLSRQRGGLVVNRTTPGPPQEPPLLRSGMEGQPGLRELLESPPILHGEDDSRVSFGIQPTFLRYLVDAVNPRSTTLRPGRDSRRYVSRSQGPYTPTSRL